MPRPPSSATLAELKNVVGAGNALESRADVAPYMTDFRRASAQADEIISIHYDTYANLAAQGIIPRARHDARVPAPFPGDFVPDPAY